MKNIVIGAISIIIMMITLLFIYTVQGREVREQELNDGMNNAMQIAAEMLLEDTEYKPESNEEFVSDFTQAFLMHINSESAVKIEILDVDYTTGLLSVRATSYYNHLTGSSGSVSLTKTIILEEYENENAVNKYTVTYYVNGSPYKEYELQEGADFLVPVSPEGSFAGWKAENGLNAGMIYSKAQLANLAVTEDVSFIAVFN